MPGQRRKQAARWGIGLLFVLAMASAGMGFELWQGLGIAGVAIVLAGADRVISKRRQVKDQRIRTRLSREERACKSCGADLWGLDVKPGRKGKYRIKCGECGVITEVKPQKRVSIPAAKSQWEQADTRSFKIR